MEANYEKIKTDLLDFGKRNNACTGQYVRLHKAESMDDVIAVVKDNFWWCAEYKDFADVIAANKEQFAEYRIYANQDIEVSDGVAYLIVTEGAINAKSYDTSTINAKSYDTSKINAESYGTSTINAESWNTSTINAKSFDTSKINAESYGTSTINAKSFDTSTINAKSYDTSKINCQVKDCSIFHDRLSHKIILAGDAVQVERR